MYYIKLKPIMATAVYYVNSPIYPREIADVSYQMRGNKQMQVPYLFIRLVYILAFQGNPQAPPFETPQSHQKPRKPVMVNFLGEPGM